MRDKSVQLDQNTSGIWEVWIMTERGLKVWRYWRKCNAARRVNLLKKEGYHVDM